MKLSVVLPTYNGANYLALALDSILTQTYTDFELLVINDGSTDKTASILAAYAKKDKRLHVITQPNKGLVASLNHGIELASGEYIARHDDDDVSHPERFMKQVAFLDSHPDVAIVGSSMSVMDDAGQVLHNHAVLLQDPELRHELLIRSPFPHGSVVFRKSAAVNAGLYNGDTWPAEDYDLWLRMSQQGQLANIDDYLYTYRENSKGISSMRQQEQAEKTAAVRARAWELRRVLLNAKRIDVSAYLKLDMGGLRIKRILDNYRQVHHKAWQSRDSFIMIRNFRLIAGSPRLYRDTAGKIKRKLRKKVDA
ncbi:MAG: glycosyltransferase family 2 protein [Candidatus Saccharibacteria bacterium]|nr:glycosyltransferase family 2 protein [Candidatus Saccharibacteria bacterium]